LLNVRGLGCSQGWQSHRRYVTIFVTQAYNAMRYYDVIMIRTNGFDLFTNIKIFWCDIIAACSFAIIFYNFLIDLKNWHKQA